MNRTAPYRVVFCAVLLTFFAVVMAVTGGEQRPTSRAEFMRMKLDYSKNLLEGLTLENYDAISKSAKALKAPQRSGGVGGPEHPRRNRLRRLHQRVPAAYR